MKKHTFAFLIVSFMLSCSSNSDPNLETLEKSKPQKEWLNSYNKKQKSFPATKQNQFVKQKKSEIEYISIHHFMCTKEIEQINNNWYGHKSRGFGDIAYHYIVSDDGSIHIGRDESRAPASNTYYLTMEQIAKQVKRYNAGRVVLNKSFADWTVNNVPGNTKGHITVSLLCGGKRVKVKGKTKVIEHPELLSPEAMENVAKLVAELLIKYELTPKNVRAHREFATTNCPNDEVYKWLRGASMNKEALGAGMKMITLHYDSLKKSN